MYLFQEQSHVSQCDVFKNILGEMVAKECQEMCSGMLTEGGIKTNI